MISRGRLINEMHLAGADPLEIKKVSKLKFSQEDIDWLYYKTNYDRLFKKEVASIRKAKEENPDLPNFKF